jgi:hypothetical protein
VGAAVLAILAITVGVAISTRNDTPSDASPQIGRIQQSCRDWTDSDRNGPDNAWCGQMAGWMSSHMGQGSMMWRDAAAVRRTCQDWMSANPGMVPDGANASTWCSQMATWMDQHHDDWDGWMGGPMMGGP